MVAILLALAAAAGYGGSDYWAGLAARRTSVIRVTILAEVAATALLALILPWAALRSPSLASLGWGAAAGAAEVLGALALYMGYRRAAFSVAGPLSAVGAAGFSVVAGLLFGERPGVLALAGIVLALPAIVGVSIEPAEEAEQAEEAEPAGQGGAEDRPAGAGRHAQGVIWGLVAGACFGVLFIALNRAGSGGGLWPVAAAQGAALVVAVGIGAVTRDLHLPAPGGRWLGVLTGVAGGGGTLLYFLATQAGLLAVTAVITSLYPAVTIVLARLLLGERLTVIRLAGLGLAAASVGLIAVSGAG